MGSEMIAVLPVYVSFQPYWDLGFTQLLIETSIEERNKFFSGE
jgi:hypothetical protein